MASTITHTRKAGTMATKWYRRNGKRASEKEVLAARDNYAEAKETGKMGLLLCSVQPAVAERVRRMTAKEFASWSGQYSWRDR